MTASEGKHTPGLEAIPSVPSDGFECYWLRIGGREVGCLNGPQSVETKKLAENITRAVNSHQDLVDALTAMVGNFKPFTMKPVGAPGSSARADQDSQIEAYKLAHAALAKVQP